MESCSKGGALEGPSFHFMGLFIVFKKILVSVRGEFVVVVVLSLSGSLAWLIAFIVSVLFITCFNTAA